MLQIIIPASESWDAKLEEFVVSQKEQILKLEHSLLSISKWESNWCKPFLTSVEKTQEETLDYIKCMTISPNVDPQIYDRLTSDHLRQINDYITSPKTATYIHEDGHGKGGRETVTSELIYYWMIALNIPSEYEKWHLNRLLTLVKVCNIKNAPPKKRSKRDIMSRNAALNASRKSQLNTRG